MLGEVECRPDELLCFGEVGGDAVQATGGIGEVGVETLLLGAEQVNWDGVVVVGLEELALAAFDALLGGSQLFSLCFAVLAQLFEPITEKGFEVSTEVGLDADAVVKILDEVFGVVHLDGAEGAVVAFGVPGGAGVVRVGHTVAVGGFLDEHPGPAVAAVEGGFEVVVVADGALAVDLAGHDGLDRFECLAVDQWFVGAGVAHALDADDAGVVRIAEHVIDVAPFNGLFDKQAAWDGGEATAGELFGEGTD